MVRAMNSEKRKVVVLCGDGMGDEPAAALGGKTPLQAADVPEVRAIAGRGRQLLIQTVPDGMAPGSDVANLGLLGYDARTNYTGRAAIEAVGSGVELAPDEVAYRTNLVTIEDGKMLDYSCGEISTPEGIELLHALDAAARADGVKFHDGVSYRHLLTLRDGPTGLTLWPAHEITNRPIAEHLPAGEGAERLLRLMDLSREVFANHPVNAARAAAGKRTATQIWPWGCGKAMRLEKYGAKFGRRGSVITAVNLVRGLARLAGLEIREVEGATGWVDTNYAGKAAACLAALEAGDDFVYVHVEAPDECGHKMNPPLKTKAIEDFNAKIVRPVWRELEARGEPYRLVVCMDHRTPCTRGGHTADPVPFAWLDGPIGGTPLDARAAFDEFVPGEKPLPLAFEVMQGLLA
jgi:2,3-bisphosphoglycerate-independent phosphoglycerate mutase